MNFGYALGQGLAGAATAGAQVMDNQIKEDADARAANRNLYLGMRLMAAQEAMNVRADERRQQYKIGDEKRADQRLTDPARASAIAQANAAGAQVTDAANRQLAIGQAGDKSYMAAARALALNQHIFSPAESIRADEARFDLQQKKDLAKARDEYATAVASGDKVAAQKAQNRVLALTGGTKDFTEREKARAATLMATLKDIDATPEEKKAARAELDRLTSGGGQGSPQASLDQLLGLQIAQTASEKAQKPGAADKGKSLMEQAKSAQGVQMGNGGDKVLASIESDAVTALTPLAREYQTAQAQYVAAARSGDQASLARHMQAMEAARQKLESEAQNRFGNAAQRVLDNLLAQK